MKPQTEIHLSNSFKTEQFRKLQKEWYDRLEKEGFKDIESEKGFLKEWSSWFDTHYTAQTFESKRQYYVFAERFLLAYSFENNIEKKIWECHCEGKSIRATVEILKRDGVEFYYKNKVNKIIRHLISRMNSHWKSEVTRKMGCPLTKK